MQKITEKDLNDYILDKGEKTKEHYKHSSFFMTSTYTFDQSDVEAFQEEGIDATDFLNVCVKVHGMWDECYGFEWLETDFYNVTYREEYVPEVVVPAHYATKEEYVEFKPTWE